MMMEEDRQAEFDFLSACNQKFPVLMSTIFQEVSDVVKIGEGIFGEVYACNVPISEIGEVVGEHGHGDADGKVGVVYKVVPIQGEELVNSERQKKFDEVRPEVIITRELAKLNVPDSPGGFVQMHTAYLGIGEYPEILVEAWKQFDNIYDSDNDVPKFAQDQKFMVLMFEHGGGTGSYYMYKDAKQAFFLILQTIYMFAGAEAKFHFEHRDLHGNNILVRTTDEEFKEIKVNGDGKVVRVPTGGVVPTIIDYTFSRIKDDENGRQCFLDMAKDNEMFMSKGDYQFDIYRVMRDQNRNKWDYFNPKSNLIWMHYLLDKLIRKAHWLDKESHDHRFFLRRMYHLKSRILMFSSCQDFIASPLCAKYGEIPHKD